MDAAVETVDLSKSFGSTVALDNLNVRIPEGVICGLFGANGSGKSTLLAMAADLIRPTSGRLTIFGEPVAGRGMVGSSAYVSQGSPLLGSMTVADMLRVGREMNGPSWDDGHARALVEGADIDLRARCGTLSAGSRASVALALALAKRPQLVLLDEPAASLDPVARESFFRMLLGDVAERGTTIVLSSHAPAELEEICDFAVIVGRGSCLVHGRIDDLLDSHTLALSADPAAEGQARGLRAVSRPEDAGAVLLRGPSGDIPDTWMSATPTLSEFVVGYLRQGAST